MLKINSILNKSQEQKASQSWPKQEIISQVENFFHDKPYGYIEVLDYILHNTSKYRISFPSQSTIAYRTGLSRRQVIRVIQQLEKDGLISTIYRHMNTLLYSTTAWFKNPLVASRLRHIFKAIRAPLMATLIIQLSMSITNRNVTQTIVSKELANFKKNIDLDYTRMSPVLTRMNQDGWTEKWKLIARGIKKVDYQVSEAIKHLKSIQLTQRGMVAVAAYPDYILELADNQMLKSFGIQDRFKYFVSLCNNYCRRDNVIPDWNLSRLLANSLKIKENIPFYVKPTNDPKPVMQSVYRSSNQQQKTHKQERGRSNRGWLSGKDPGPSKEMFPDHPPAKWKAPDFVDYMKDWNEEKQRKAEEFRKQFPFEKKTELIESLGIKVETPVTKEPEIVKTVSNDEPPLENLDIYTNPDLYDEVY